MFFGCKQQNQTLATLSKEEKKTLAKYSCMTGGLWNNRNQSGFGYSRSQEILRGDIYSHLWHFPCGGISFRVTLLLASPGEKEELLPWLLSLGRMNEAQVSSSPSFSFRFACPRELCFLFLFFSLFVHALKFPGSDPGTGNIMIFQYCLTLGRDDWFLFFWIQY